MILLDLGSPDRELRDRARLLRPMPTNPPKLDRDPPAEVLARAAVSAAISTKDALDAELFNVARIGLMLSSGRPGVKKLMFVLTDRTNPKRKLECALVTSVPQDNFVLVADCMGRTDEVARIPLADPSAPAAVRAAVEKFVLDTTERFARPVTK
jgi:hypothetical protein